MSNNVITFRTAAGTTRRDLEDVRRVLRGADGWTVEELPGDVPWIVAAGPGGSEWAIGRQNGAFFAALDHGLGAAWDGLKNAEDAARVVASVSVPLT